MFQIVIENDAGGRIISKPLKNIAKAATSALGGARTPMNKPASSVVVHTTSTPEQKTSSVGSPQTPIPNTYNTQNTFILPEEKDKLIAALKRSIRLILPTHTNGKQNLAVLIKAFDNDNYFVGDLIHDTVEYHASLDDANLLTKWRIMLSELGCIHLIPMIESFIDTAIKKLVPVIDDLEQIFIDETMSLFDKTRKRPNNGRDDMLTEVKFTPDVASFVSSTLGVKYDLFQMINSSELSGSILNIYLHNNLLDLFKKAGLSKNELISREKTSKSKIAEFLVRNKAFIETLGIFARTPIKTDDLIYKKYDLEIPLEMPEELKKLSLRTEAVLQKESNTGKDARIGKEISELAGWISSKIYHESLLVTEDRNCIKLSTILKSCKWRLDPWQKSMIDSIKAGESVLVQTPTSAGKTFASMSALEWIFNTSNKTVIYIAPKVDLAFQTYNNIKATFPRHVVALVTGRISDIPVDARIWVGTPIELWAYLSTTRVLVDKKTKKETEKEIKKGNKKNSEDIEVTKEKKEDKEYDFLKFSIAIFDEVHTLSTSFGYGEEARLRAEAIGNLLTVVEKPHGQIVALSATIHDEDIPVLKTFISQQSGIAVIKEELYPDRPVPQENLMWNGYTYRRMNEHTEFVETKVTPEATFDFLRKLVSDEELNPETGKMESKVPVMIFEESPRICYNNFVEYINWVTKKDKEVYFVWYKAQSIINKKIETLNASMRPIYEVYVDALNVSKTNSKTAFRGRDDSGIAKKASPNKVSSAVDKVISKVLTKASERRELVLTVKKDLMNAVNESIARDDISKRKRYTLISSEYLRTFYNKVFTTEEGPAILPSTISVETSDLLRQLEFWMSMRRPLDDDVDSTASLDRVCVGIGPYFRIGESSSEITNIRAMLNTNVANNEQQLRNELLMLCEAERIREDEIRPLFELICKGLEFGIGLFISTMPFVVHYNMLKLLSTKKIKALFSSADLAMGVNYPIKTVCIRANTEQEMNVCEYMQMAGRSGRRGLDRIGYVMAWNIKNASTAGQKTLPRIVLPDIGPNFGTQIKNPLIIARDIEIGRYYSRDLGGETAKDSDLDKVVQKMKYTKSKSGSTEEKTYVDSDEDEDDEDYEGEGLEVKVVTEKKGVTNISDVALASMLTACIAPVASSIGLTDEEMIELADRVQKIAQGQISEYLKDQSYENAQKIAMVKTALAELHTRLHLSQNENFLKYIRDVFELLHRVQLRQMRL